MQRGGGLLVHAVQHGFGHLGGVQRKQLVEPSRQLAEDLFYRCRDGCVFGKKLLCCVAVVEALNRPARFLLELQGQPLQAFRVALLHLHWTVQGQPLHHLRASLGSPPRLRLG